jgi:hypothetical protein
VFQLFEAVADRKTCPEPHRSLTRITDFITALMTPHAAAVEAEAVTEAGDVAPTLDMAAFAL